MIKKIRIAFLLVVLVIVAGTALLSEEGDRDWTVPHTMVIYPINGDASDKAAAYIASLSIDDFAGVARFINEEAARYGIDLPEPLVIELNPKVTSRPPDPPFGGSRFKIAMWSLAMRWWAWRNSGENSSDGARMFVQYFDPATASELDHSVGLKQGRLGVVKAYGAPVFAGRNQVIIAHEYLHTLGATDKYDLASGMPLYPQGYAEPKRIPLYPQERVALMGGLVPVSESEGEMPQGLWQVLIVPESAREIGWLVQDQP